jgi:hypothetical protein
MLVGLAFWVGRWTSRKSQEKAVDEIMMDTHVVGNGPQVIRRSEANPTIILEKDGSGIAELDTKR